MVRTLLLWPLAALALIVALWPPVPIPAPSFEAAPAEGTRLSGAGRLVLGDDGWLILTLRGDPYEMGRQQGQLLGPELRALVGGELFPWLDQAGVSAQARETVARAAFGQLPPPWQAELRGIAEGAGLPLEPVVLWNMAPTLWMLGAGASDEAAGLLTASESAESEQAQPVLAPMGSWPPLFPRPAAPGPRPSSAFTAWGTGTADGEGFLGATLGAELSAGRPLLVIRHPTDGVATLGVALPGEVGYRAGMNGQGLALVALTEPNPDQRLAGLTPGQLLREMLESQAGAESTLRAIIAAPRSIGTTWVVADPTQGALMASAAHTFAVDADPAPWRLAENGSGGTPPAATERWLQTNSGWLTPAAAQSHLLRPESGGASDWVRLVARPATGELWLAQPAGGAPAPTSGFARFEVASLLLTE